MTSPLPAEIHAICRAGGFDLDTLDGLAEVLGNQRIQRLFQITRIEFAEALDRLGRAVAAQDIDRTRSEAHALRGAASNIGALAVADAIERYEEGLRDGVFCPVRLGAIEQAVAVADTALSQLGRDAQG